MTPKLNLTGIRMRQCIKPGCARHPIQRHHKGSEAMWLRHFLHRRRTKRWQKFKRRYYEFRPRDTVDICIFHHEEITAINYRLIARWMERYSFGRRCATWSWEEAEALMKHLRRHCNKWLKIETPGLEPKRVAGKAG